MTRRTDRDATAFIEANYERLAKMAMVMAGNPHDGADLLHDVLEKLFRKWPSRGPDNPWGLAKTIMARSSIDGYRKRSREVLDGSIYDVISVDPNPLDADLLDALKGLSPKQRTAVALRYIDDLSIQEISVICSTSSVATRANISRGTSALRNKLSETHQIRRGLS